MVKMRRLSSMRIFRSILVVCLVIALSSCSTNNNDTSRKQAIDYNEQGAELFEQKKYEDALELFKNSFEHDDSYFLAHYNYAAALGMLMKEDYPRWFGRKDEIIEHLQKVIELNPDYVEQIKQDHSFEKIHKHFGYLRLIGLTVESSDDVKTILQTLNWHVLGNGIVSVIGGANFLEDDTFYLWYYPTEFWEKYDFDLGLVKYFGKYEVEKNKITLYLDEKMLRKRSRDDIHDNNSVYDDITVLEGEMLENGNIRIDIFDYELKWFRPEFSA